MNCKTALNLIFFSCVFITACNGQEEPTKPYYITTRSTEIPNENFVPLFYPGQLCHWVRDILQDQRGDLWLGTNHYGIVRYDGDTLQYFSENNGVGDTRISGIEEDQNGNLWFATAAGLTKYADNTFTNYAEKEGLANSEIWCLKIDNSGLIWVGTSEGAYTFDGRTFTAFALPESDVVEPNFMVSPKRISSIYQDRKGIMWITTDGAGVYNYDGTTITHRSTKNGLPDNSISQVMEDRSGNFWFTTNFSGVIKYDGKTFTNFTKDGVLNGTEAGALYEDKQGNIWFAVEHTGIYKYDGTTFTLYNDGDYTNGIITIFEDDQGRFWFGGWKGLFRFDGKVLTPVTKTGPWE